MYCSTSCPPQPSSQPPGDVHTASIALPIPCCCYWLSLAVLYLVMVGGWVGGWLDGWFVGWSVGCLLICVEGSLDEWVVV